MSEEAGRTLPKFGEWDVNNPASADGFTVIFSKARDEKKGPMAGAGAGAMNGNASTRSADSRSTDKMSSYSSRTTTRASSSKKWFCCVSPTPTQP